MKQINPLIIVDSREKTPLQFEHYQTKAATLTTGDYSIKGMESSFSIERKSTSDLIGSITYDRPRFTRELERLRGYSFKRLLIIGSLEQIKAGEYRSKATPAAILGSLNALEIRFDIPVVFASTPTAAALLVEQWAFYFWREQIQQAQSIIDLTTQAKPQQARKVRAL